jgi:hypothetical protein
LLTRCSSLEEVFAAMNREGPRERWPDGYQGRSLSVGDVVWDPDGRGWMCAGAGWVELEGLRLSDKGLEPVYSADLAARSRLRGQDDRGGFYHDGDPPSEPYEFPEHEDAVEMMRAGHWAYARGMPEFDYAGLVERGIGVAVLEDFALRTIIEEARDLGAREVTGGVLCEGTAPLEWGDMRQVTIVRTGADALARRTLHPASRRRREARGPQRATRRGASRGCSGRRPELREGAADVARSRW